VLCFAVMRNLSLIRKLSVFAVVVLAVSCSDDDDGGGPGSGSGGSRFSCSDADGSFCQAYVGSPEPIPQMRDACTMGMGVVGETCSGTGIVGSCTIASGPSSMRFIYYTADGVDVGKTICQGSGTWTDGS
jgi:hypothetical protein